MILFCRSVQAPSWVCGFPLPWAADPLSTLCSQAGAAAVGSEVVFGLSSSVCLTELRAHCSCSSPAPAPAQLRAAPATTKPVPALCLLVASVSALVAAPLCPFPELLQLCALAGLGGRKVLKLLESLCWRNLAKGSCDPWGLQRVPPVPAGNPGWG